MLNDVALAPMEGVTDVTFRRLIRQIGGCGLTCTEFVPARGLADLHTRISDIVQFDPEEHPICIQVFGRDPVALAEGARVAQDLGADVVDLNMGCPSKQVCANSGGSALMKEPALVAEIVRTMRAAVDIPLTVKMRAGWDATHRNAPALAAICEGEGAEAVTVHWRTRADKYAGERDLGVIADVVDRVGIPVLANGDIIDAASALEVRRATGCAGWMVGRGAVRNPWVFLEIGDALAGRAHVPPTLHDKEQVLLGYYASLRMNFRSDLGALGRMKKIARYFTQGVPDGARLRTAIFHSHTVDEAEERVRSFFEQARNAGSAA